MKYKRLKFGKGFRVVFDTRRGQAAEMVIAPGDAEGDSQQSSRRARINGCSSSPAADAPPSTVAPKALRAGDLLLIEKNDRHEIRNTGRTLLRTLNFYTPPAYTKSGNPNPSGKPSEGLASRHDDVPWHVSCSQRALLHKGDVMDQPLKGKTVAILATDGFEQSELDAPKAALEKAGATSR